jgi:NADPH2:quinone reductase
MKAVRFHELGGPEVLRCEDVADPLPGLGQIRIRVAAAGMNYADVVTRYGKYFGLPTFPATPGLEASGTIDMLGDGVEDWRVGDAVMVIGTEAYAEWMVADAVNTFPVPDGVDLVTAAAYPIIFFTAWGLLHDVGDFETGQSVLITAAAGGVGTALTQLVRHEGGKPIAVASDSRKIALSRDLGATFAVSYNDPEWPDRVREASGGGVDLLLDGVGGEIFRKGFKLVKPYGRAVAYGAASLEAQQVGLRDVIRSHVSFTGFFLPTMLRSRQKRERMMAALYPAFSSRALKPLLGGVSPLADAVEAQRRLERRETIGKMLLVP